MDYSESILRCKDYYPDENESIVDKWLMYKSGKKGDLDTYIESFYKMFWPDLITEICFRRETMTSPLVTFEEYAFFKGFKWKSQKAHGVNTFISFMQENCIDWEKDFGKEFLCFIELSTSRCNMIPVPDYFNTGRSGPYAKWDYWDLALIQIKKWFDYRKGNDEIGMKDALRLLFAHSTHNYVFSNRSTNMFDSIKYTEIWLSKYNSWKDFITSMYLESFVDKNNEWIPILFWDSHSYELPLPTDTEYNINKNEAKYKQQVETNFVQFFERVNRMLLGRSKYLKKKEEELV